MKWQAYWQLMRFNKPTGIFLLWYPTTWALLLCNAGSVPIKLLVLTTIGTLCMRAAGCIVNDIADRQFDIHVSRTQLRPLASRQIHLMEAWILLLVLLLCALEVVIHLPLECFYTAIVALMITCFYPLCKRFFAAPQIVLGVAFSMGIPLAYSASLKSFDKQFYLLFLINFIWILSYDTMYAMADKEDDIRIGVKSTAILFAEYDHLVVAGLQLCLHGLWLYLASLLHANWQFYFFWASATLILFYQQKLINSKNAHRCLRAFVISSYYGAIMTLAVGSLI